MLRQKSGYDGSIWRLISGGLSSQFTDVGLSKPENAYL